MIDLQSFFCFFRLDKRGRIKSNCYDIFEISKNENDKANKENEFDVIILMINCFKNFIFYLLII